MNNRVFADWSIEIKLKLFQNSKVIEKLLALSHYPEHPTFLKFNKGKDKQISWKPQICCMQVLENKNSTNYITRK